MADKENSSRLIRSTMRKRAHDSAPLVTLEAAKRPRVVLGELCNLDDPSSRPQEYPLKPKFRARKRKHSDAPNSEQEDAEKPLGVLDIDYGGDDPQLCRQYADDIHKYLRSMEVSPTDLNSWIRFIVFHCIALILLKAESKRRPLPDFIEVVQKDVTPNMRSILVDWLVEVAEDYKLLSDTLYLSISYIDRFLSGNPIKRQQLRLLGISSMLIAS